jgi:long-chain fatty acid transport protein
MRLFRGLVASMVLTGSIYAGGPFPSISGISATVNDAAVAGLNPAGMTHFDERAGRLEVLGFFRDSTWEGRLGEEGPVVSIDDDGALVVPVGALVMPFRDNWWFGFTVQGAGFSEDYDDDWPGRYFLQEYELLYVSAFPSIATKLTDKLSVAASLALTYTTYDQRKAVINVEPGYGDGSLVIETDGVSLGFGLSMMYEISERSRVGAVYRSEIEPELDGTAQFSGLGPITEAILDNAGLIGANIDVTSRQPQSLTAGISHDFLNNHTLTADVVWVDFSEFTLAEIFVNGDQIIENEAEYQDIFAFATSYSWPVADRWRVGVGGFYAQDGVGDQNRTMAFRLDDIWSVGFGFQWQWKSNRMVSASLNYLKVGDAPVKTPEIPGIGGVTGRFTDRGTIYLRAAVSFGPDNG